MNCIDGVWPLSSRSSKGESFRQNFSQTPIPDVWTENMKPWSLAIRHIPLLIVFISSTQSGTDTTRLNELNLLFQEINCFHRGENYENHLCTENKRFSSISFGAAALLLARRTLPFPPDIYWQRVFFFKNKNRFRFHCERFFHSHSLRVVIVCVCVCIMFYFHSTHLTMSILLFSLARLFVFGAKCERMNAAKHLRWPNYSKFLRAWW